MSSSIVASLMYLSQDRKRCNRVIIHLSLYPVRCGSILSIREIYIFNFSDASNFDETVFI